MNIVYQLPVQRRVATGALHARLAFDHVGVVVRGHRALLPPERLRRVESRLRQRLRVDAPLRGHRIAHAVYAVRDHVADRFRADVAGGAIADPQACVESFGRQRRAAVHAVAEAQHRVAVVFGLDNEFGRLRTACKQIALRGPAAQIAFAAHIDRRAHIGDVEHHRRSGARGRVDQRRRIAAGHPHAPLLRERRDRRAIERIARHASAGNSAQRVGARRGAAVVGQRDIRAGAGHFA